MLDYFLKITEKVYPMKYIEKHPILMIAVGVIGISLSSIFVNILPLLLR